MQKGKWGEDGLDVLLIERKAPPYQGMWATPGGFIELHEELEAAARIAGDMAVLEKLRTAKVQRVRVKGFAWSRWNERWYFVLAVLGAFYVFLKYAKLWEKSRAHRIARSHGAVRPDSL